MKKSFLIFSFFVGASTVFSIHSMDSSKVRKSLKVFNFENEIYISRKDIVDRFKGKSLVLHPDRGGSTEEMQSLSEARDILLDCVSRFEEWAEIKKAARRELKRAKNQRSEMGEEFAAIAAIAEARARQARANALKSSF